MSKTTLYLKRGKEESLKRLHPWIFSGAVHHIDGNPEEGDVVDIYTSEGNFIAKGHWQIGSIAVRVLSFEQERIDVEFWKRRLQAAFDVRKSIGVAGVANNNTYRLVHGEGDNLPALSLTFTPRMP
jgi:23S rRNA (cytosine1962-C5)-methyltransferase